MRWSLREVGDACDMAQRRRTAEDEVNMRSIFEEGDLISVRPFVCLVQRQVTSASEGTGCSTCPMRIKWLALNAGGGTGAACRRIHCTAHAQQQVWQGACAALLQPLISCSPMELRGLQGCAVCVLCALQLRGGQLVEVSPNLVKRQKQHFNDLDGVGARPFDTASYSCNPAWAWDDVAAADT